MAINHELSSDIAVALLTDHDRDPKELNELKEVVLKVHAELQKLTAESHRSRTFAKAAGTTGDEI